MAAVRSWIVFLLILTAYSLTLMPGTVGGDAGELQYAGPLLALVHPTGQPLYVLIGKIWSMIIPFGSVAYKMNLLAAVSSAAGAASLTYLIIRAYQKPWIGMAAGLTLGFGATIWGQSVLADKYGFNVLLAAWIVGLALWWEKERRDSLLYALSAAFGIGLLHHRSLALFAVGIVIMVVWHLRADLWHKWRRTLICIALVILPALTIYPTVLPLLRANNATPLNWQPNTPTEWVEFLLERHVISGEALNFAGSSTTAERLEIYAQTIINDYTVILVIVAGIGFLTLLYQHPAAGVFLLISYGLQAVLSANFRGNDRQFTYYIPSFVTLLYAYAYGLVSLITRLQAWKKMSVWALRAGAFALPVIIVISAYPTQARHAHYGETLDLWRQTLKTGNMGARLTAQLESLPTDAVIAADWEQVTILWYEQQVENRRKDLTIIYPIERYIDYIDTHPVCLARHLPAGDTWHYTNIGAFVCLNNTPQITPPHRFTPLNVDLFTPEGNAVIRLIGYQADFPADAGGEHIPVTLIWQALTDIEDDYSISIQVLHDDWTPSGIQRDIQSPVMGLYPTSRWISGEIVQDYHEISIPPDTAPGRYLWTVVMYQIMDGQFIQLQDADGNINILGGMLEVKG